MKLNIKYIREALMCSETRGVDSHETLHYISIKEIDGMIEYAGTDGSILYVAREEKEGEEKFQDIKIHHDDARLIAQMYSQTEEPCVEFETGKAFEKDIIKIDDSIFINFARNMEFPNYNKIITDLEYKHNADTYISFRHEYLEILHRIETRLYVRTPKQHTKGARQCCLFKVDDNRKIYIMPTVLRE